MKLLFDPTQPHQLEVIQVTTNLFTGQSIERGLFEQSQATPKGQFQLSDATTIGNQLEVGEDIILKNLQSVQKENNLEVTEKLNGLNFSIEMETGTGKTYVYLRTIHELNKQYGFKKFVIVVPSIAIKEGVVKNLQITQEHFATLYNNPEMNFYVYDPKKRGQLRSFATASSLQILVINIDSFAKFSESKKGRNIIYKQSDWGVPIEFIQSTNPITIIDEPQNMETEKRKQAIENLNPLCTLRYSATHKHHYNLIYKLDPVQAYDLGLVKKNRS
jgi:type III restriction enzyme